MPPWVQIVIVAFNSGEILTEVIAALVRQTMADFQVVIVDNASTDGHFDRIVLPDDRFRVIRSPVNLGFAAGCNLGARHAAAPWLAMLNPDAVPDPDWLAELRQATLRFPMATMFGSTQIQAHDPTRLDGAGDNYSIFGIPWRGGFGARCADTRRQDAAVFSPCAAAALYERTAFETAGGFDPSFFCYIEDVDLAFRLRLNGHKTIQVAAARVSHVGSSSTGRYSDFTLFHSARNSVFMLIRCMPPVLLLVSLPLFLTAQIWLMYRMRRFASPWARLRGVGAGLRAIPRLLPQRRTIQRARVLTTGQLARLLVWNPRRLSRRDIVVLPGESHRTPPPPQNAPTE